MTERGTYDALVVGAGPNGTRRRRGTVPSIKYSYSDMHKDRSACQPQKSMSYSKDLRLTELFGSRQPSAAREMTSYVDRYDTMLS